MYSPSYKPDCACAMDAPWPILWERSASFSAQRQTGLDPSLERELSYSAWGAMRSPVTGLTGLNCIDNSESVLWMLKSQNSPIPRREWSRKAVIFQDFSARIGNPSKKFAQLKKRLGSWIKFETSCWGHIVVAKIGFLGASLYIWRKGPISPIGSDWLSSVTRLNPEPVASGMTQPLTLARLGLEINAIGHPWALELSNSYLFASSQLLDIFNKPTNMSSEPPSTSVLGRRIRDDALQLGPCKKAQVLFY